MAIDTIHRNQAAPAKPGDVAAKLQAKAKILGLIIADLRTAQTSINLIGQSLTDIAMNGGASSQVDADLWQAGGPKLTAAVLSLVTLSAKQNFASHTAAIGWRSVESALDIIALSPQWPEGVNLPDPEDAALSGIFNSDLRAQIELNWPHPLSVALEDVPRSPLMSAVDRQAREGMFAHWPVDLAAAKLATLIADKLLEETLIRLEVYSNTLKTDRPQQNYLFIEDAGSAFYALRSLGRAAMHMAQVARREGADIVPGNPPATGFEYGAKTVCHALRLVAIKSFDLYREANPALSMPGWTETLRSAKILTSSNFNMELTNAYSAPLFRPKSQRNTANEGTTLAAGVG